MKDIPKEDTPHFADTATAHCAEQDKQRADAVNLAKSVGARVWQSYRKEDCGQYKQADFTLTQLIALVETVQQAAQTAIQPEIDSLRATLWQQYQNQLDLLASIEQFETAYCVIKAEKLELAAQVELMRKALSICTIKKVWNGGSYQTFDAEAVKKALAIKPSEALAEYRKMVLMEVINSHECFRIDNTYIWLRDSIKAMAKEKP